MAFFITLFYRLKKTFSLMVGNLALLGWWNFDVWNRFSRSVLRWCSLAYYFRIHFCLPAVSGVL